MSAWECAPGAGSQPGTERGWGWWWGVSGLGGEATCLGREGRVFPGGRGGWVRAHTLGSRGQGEWGTQVGGKRGEGTTALAPPTRGLLGTGPGFQPHRNRNPRNSPVRLHSTLSFFWSERETDRNKEEEDQESQASYSLAQTPGMPGSTRKPGPHGGVPPRPSHTPSLVSASSEVGLAGTCIHTGCVLPGTFPPADCSDTGS